MHGRYIRIFYYIGYSGSKQFDVGVVVACYGGNMGTVPAKLSFIILFVYFLFFSLFGVLLIRELLIKLLAVLSEICKFLAFIAFVVTDGFLFIRVFSLKHHCKVFCQLDGLFANKLGFGGGQYLLYFNDYLILLLKQASCNGLEVIM